MSVGPSFRNNTKLNWGQSVTTNCFAELLCSNLFANHVSLLSLTWILTVRSLIPSALQKIHVFFQNLKEVGERIPDRSDSLRRGGIFSNLPQDVIMAAGSSLAFLESMRDRVRLKGEAPLGIWGFCLGLVPIKSEKQNFRFLSFERVQKQLS